MLVDLNDVLVPARGGKYVVGLFSTINLELARGVMEATEELDSPVIIGIAEVLPSYGPLEDLTSPLIPMVGGVSVLVVARLDHGPRGETCRLALGLELSSIMHDCSIMDYGDNMERVKKMAETAHFFGVSIEVELGHVGDNGGGSAEGSDPGAEPSQFYTDPVQMRDFADQTGADILAIAVDTVHGAYELPPELDFNQILEIAGTIPILLALHDGSGLSNSDFKTTAERGTDKVNTFTDTSQVGARAADSGYGEGIGLTDTILLEIGAVKQSVVEEMRLFDSVRQESGR